MAVHPAADLREAIDIDSMGFLNFIRLSIIASVSIFRKSTIRNSSR
jgi:hypothetical protein